MSSNILAGERRWASARRTGMTVLGKVAVPKPLNLPSQRLENHGLDPSVEIVPKGTLGWGSRPSSSASNPWGSSSVSSTAEGYGSSPGHPSGRPSSSGSRPSTAGSEITHDHGSNAWGPSSRPSSASGISASNQTSLTSLRPHSAETRPASSQMSRFAEQHTDSAVAHHPERAGLASSSDKERFSLSSGDFPTLNSIADGSVKSSDSRDQGSCSRPSSASGVVAKKDNLDKPQADVESGSVNAWKREGYRSNDEMHPSTDKWHGEPPRYHNANVPSPHFDGWRGPSMNHPGVWYQGLPPGPPYGAPGGFPVEQFPFYCPPRMPPSGLQNSLPVPLTGPGPGPMGHPKNGELFRPPMPDAFVRPGMPFRPGFYPGPMPFEGYYGPPMGYCNPNEREVPFNGMPVGPPVYNRYPARDSDPVAFNDSTTTHNRTDKNGPGIKRLSEKVEQNHLDDVPRQVLLKKNHADVNHAGWGENMATQNYPNPKKRSQPGMAMRTKEWGADYNSDDDMYPRSATHVLHSSSGPKDDCSGSVTFINRPQCHGSGDNVAMDNIRLKNLETTASSSPVLPPEPLAGDGGLSSSAMGPTLIQKIEGLNEKVRTSDSRNEGSHPSHWAEQKGAGAIIGEIIVPFGDDTSNVTAASRRGYGVVRGKTDNNKQKFNSPGDADGWQKKLPASVQSADISSASIFHKNRTTTAVVAAVDVLEKQEMDSEVVDSADSQTQRLKMRESVKQRALQLQKEEEERTREQKAKALAKLEELNRRTPVGKTMTQKDENVLLSGISQQDEGSQAPYESSRTVAKSISLSPPLAETPGVRILVSESTGEWDEKPADSNNSLPCETLKTTTDTAVLPSQPLPLKELLTDDCDCVVAQLDEALASTNKQSGYKQKHSVPAEINGSRKPIGTKARHNNIEHEGTESGIVAPGNVESGSDSKTTEIHVAVESSSQQKRRSNRNIKNKHKPDDFPAPPNSSTVPDENNPADMSTNSEMSKATHSGGDKGSIQAHINVGGAGGYSKQQSSSFSEGAQGSTNLHKKPQQSRRFARNQPATRFSDKYHGNDNVVWAPVQTLNKTEPATETGLKTVDESAISAKNDDQVQNNVKSKRAEMERYVPKPVAKELAQQGSVQQSGSSSSVGISPSDDVAEKVEPEFKSYVKQSGSLAGNVVPAGESRIEDLRHSKQTKSLGGWRQRGSAEQQHSKGAHNGSSSIASNPRNQQSMEPELSNTKTEQIGLRDPSASDVANTWKDSGAGISSQGRYQENAGRGKRHALKGERSMGSDREHEKNSGSQKTDKSHNQLQDPRVNPTGRSSSSKENRDFEDRGSSHWQPKSSSTLHSGDSSSTAQNVGGGAVKKAIQSLPEEYVASNVKQSRELDSRVDPSFPKSNFLPEGTVSHQGQRREKKLPSSKGHSRAPTDATVVADDSTLAGSDESQTKQHFSSDYRRGRYQNVRSVASREPRGDLNNERHGQNLQYEYQPVGEKKLENTDDGSHGVGPRYKEKGHSHNHSRRGRGQFHGRQSSNVQVGAGYG